MYTIYNNDIWGLVGKIWVKNEIFNAHQYFLEIQTIRLDYDRFGAWKTTNSLEDTVDGLHAKQKPPKRNRVQNIS